MTVAVYKRLDNLLSLVQYDENKQYFKKNLIFADLYDKMKESVVKTALSVIYGIIKK